VPSIYLVGESSMRVGIDEVLGKHKSKCKRYS